MATIYTGDWSSTRSTTSYNNVYLYTGRTHDPNTGLYHCRHRYYHGRLGRFLTRDPIGYNGRDPNLYCYVASQPTSAVDPSGLLGYELEQVYPVLDEKGDCHLVFEYGLKGWIDWREFGLWGWFVPDLPPVKRSVHRVDLRPSDCNRERIAEILMGKVSPRQDAEDNDCELVLLLTILRKEKLDHLVDEYAPEIMKPWLMQVGLMGAGAVVRITPRGLKHVQQRHVPGGAKTAGRSTFSAGEDVSALIRQAKSVAPTPQAGGNPQRIVNAGRPIGIDRVTGQPTSVYTVITNRAGDLITAFPGIP